jgi:mono/diheme cytochrome c family protein
VDTSAIDAPAAADEPIDPAVMALGKASYMICGACHGQNGEGGPIAPPLAASEWVTGPVSNLIRIQLRGLQGPITVAGKEYNMPGGMAALSYQTDDQIAGVLTYIRNSFGNKASAVKPEQVAALRGEVGKPQVTAAELTKP